MDRPFDFEGQKGFVGSGEPLGGFRERCFIARWFLAAPDMYGEGESMST
jgi:hypothetical protein